MTNQTKMPQATDIIKNPVKRDGVSQNQRRLAALDPSFVKMDERTLEDFLVFTLEYADRVCFYNLENQQDGNWVNFWGCDPTVIIAAIEKTNPLPTKQACEAIYSQEPSVEGFSALVKLTLDIARKIDDWYQSLTPGTSLHLELKRLIPANLSGLLQQLVVFEKGATVLFESYPGLVENNYKGFSKEWGLASDLNNIAVDLSLFRPEVPINEENPAKCLDDLSQEDQLAAAYPRLKDLFTRAYNIYFYTIQIAPAHFQESLNRSDHPAHLTLFITFLMLYQQVQDDLNRMTQRHLDFYYKDVLGLKLKDAVPDKAHLFFELAKNLVEHQLDGGIRFKAGKDEMGNDLFYTLDKTAVLNTAKVESLRSIFLHTTETGNTKNITNIHVAPVANSADGLGEEIKDEDKPSWATLGNTDMPKAELGFAIASDELLLTEGHRIITLDVHTDKSITFADKPFDVCLSGEKEWIKANYTFGDNGPAAPAKPIKGFRLQITLGTDQPAVVPFVADTLKEQLGTKLPVLKLLLHQPKPDEVDQRYFYEHFRNLKINKIVLSTQVSGIQQVVAFNDEGAVDASKPFFPFTAIPKKGSSFYVGNAEAFQKSLDWVMLHLHWEQVPNEFESHYAGYEGVSGLTHDSFQAKLFSIGSEEKTANAQQTIFNPKPDDFEYDSGELSDRKVEFRIDNTTAMPLAYLLSKAKVETYGQTTKEGFLRLDLSRDFEHDQFPQVLTRQMLAASRYPTRIVGAWYLDGNTPKKANSTDPANISATEVIIPKNPYTPSLKSITLSYFSSASTAVATDAGAITFLHLHPFPDTYQHFDSVLNVPLLPQFGGQVKQLPLTSSTGTTSQKTKTKVLPTTLSGIAQTGGSTQLVSNTLSLSTLVSGQITLLEEGVLFIGLSGLQPRQSLSLLIQVAENTADADLPKAKVHWYYLSNNNWIPFEEYEVASDTTDELLTSGIVEFTIPDGINLNNTILPANLHWLKASVSDYSASVSEAINIHAQAARVTFQDNENDPNHLAKPLPAETIAKLENDDAGVKSLTQPYESFGGMTAEDSLSFYTRVSERLRHKGRAITQFDYERLVLEAFPSIYKVKCINHTNSDHSLCPGNVLISVVPDFTKLKAVDRRQPKVTLAQLEKIKRYLDGRNSCFISESAVTLHVLNPEYEKIDLDFEVRFNPDVTAIEFHLRKLKTAIVQYLSPWAYDDAAEINFGGKVFKSSILHFVEKQTYVDYVVNFKMMHDGSLQDTNIIEAKTPRSILIPVAEEEMNIRHLPFDGHCPMENRLRKKALGYQALNETVLED